MRRDSRAFSRVGRSGRMHLSFDHVIGVGGPEAGCGERQRVSRSLEFFSFLK